VNIAIAYLGHEAPPDRESANKWGRQVRDRRGGQ
jgi:hypothetical protein